MRVLLASVLRLVLGIFYQRIEIRGLENLPKSGPSIVVLNHPNGLLDPLFILCLCPRPASFLAKAPLFRIPLVGFVARTLGSIPVYRRQDEGSDTARNQETFVKARDLLAQGGVLALFPEGASHDDPKLRPLKTGAARIALGAAAQDAPGSPPLWIVPAGLTFSSKGVFRSDAVLMFGTPLAVPRTELDQVKEPPAATVAELNREIEAGLHRVILQADHDQALLLASQAESIFTAARDEAEPTPLAERVEIRQRILAGYSYLAQRQPRDVEHLASRIRRYEAALHAAGLSPESVSPSDFEFAKIASATLRTFLVASILFPLALAGVLLHYPAYWLTGFISKRMSKNDLSVLATGKVLASLILFPLTWILLMSLSGFAWGVWGAVAALVLGPFSALAALHVSERLDRFAGGTRAFFTLLFRKRQFLRLHAERGAIRRELLRLWSDVPGST